MKVKIIMAILLAAILLGACSGNGSDEGSASPVTKPSDIKELVHDYSVDKIKAENASITSKQLIVTDSGKESVYELPADEFFVSIAPYINETHP